MFGSSAACPLASAALKALRAAERQSPPGPPASVERGVTLRDALGGALDRTAYSADDRNPLRDDPCRLRFNNIKCFKGFPFVPAPEASPERFSAEEPAVAGYRLDSVECSGG